MRNLACQLPRGKLLSEMGKSLIIGRLQCNAFVTRPARLSAPANGKVDSASRGPAQVALNDLARTLLGHTRAEHFKVEDLLDRYNIPNVNEIVVRQAALEGCPRQRLGGTAHDIR